MKTIRFTIFILAITILFAACLNPWKGDEGNLTIVWGKTSESRALVNEAELDGFKYHIILSGPGDTIEVNLESDRYGGKSPLFTKTFTVSSGTWTVTIKGRDGYNNLAVMGIEQVQVTPGPNQPKTINLYTATEVGTLLALNGLINTPGYINPSTGLPGNAGEPGTATRTELFVLTGDDDFRYDTGPSYILYDRKIILITESDVTLGRVGHITSAAPSLFIIQSGGELTLGLPGMIGTLTLDGEKTPSGMSGDVLNINALIDVRDGGKLTLNNGVTIKNGDNGTAVTTCGGVDVNAGGAFIMNGGKIINNTGYNAGGVLVNEPITSGGKGGSFIMNGGTISGNEATITAQGAVKTNGGGVHVMPGGSFKHNGGAISGNTPKNVVRK